MSWPPARVVSRRMNAVSVSKTPGRPTKRTFSPGLRAMRATTARAMAARSRPWVWAARWPDGGSRARRAARKAALAMRKGYGGRRRRHKSSPMSVRRPAVDRAEIVNFAGRLLAALGCCFDGLGPRFEPGGLISASRLTKQRGVRLEGLSHVGMVWAQHALAQRQRLPVELLCLPVASLVPQHVGQAVLTDCDAGVVGLEHLLLDLQ